MIARPRSPGSSASIRRSAIAAIDLIRAGRTEELMRAIRAERSDAFA